MLQRAPCGATGEPAGYAAPVSTPLIWNAYERASESLNGRWRAIIDPYDVGLVDINGEETPRGFFRDFRPRHEGDRVEYDFDSSDLLDVPGDWNSQQDRLFFYEGAVWYRREFDLADSPGGPGGRRFVYFGAANYDTRVYLNGALLGRHLGGFGPFNFEISERVRPGRNVLIVRVDNRRRRDAVPTEQTDWWNYGGITRDVLLLEVPPTYVREFRLQFAAGSRDRLNGFVQLDGPQAEQSVRLRIDELAIDVSVEADSSGRARFDLACQPELWSPSSPRRYDVAVEIAGDRVVDRIGFRSIEVADGEILLNGEPIFLRGISIHEEAPLRAGRANSPEDARVLLGWARELGCNMVRLAHYPHNEHMARLADEMGLMVWAELPVYWNIDWSNPETLANAEDQLRELITRDGNRACTILWSVGNEAPPTDDRLRFMSKLAALARELDGTRLVTAALMARIADGGRRMILDDPLGEVLDVLGCNEYVGWYYSTAADAELVEWSTPYAKPLIMSEFGAGALQGLHGPATRRWTEEFQTAVYISQLRMLEKIPFLRGLTPWILKDFLTPRRLLPGIQDYFNRKGLISERGQKKGAFEVLRRFYAEKAD